VPLTKAEHCRRLALLYEAAAILTNQDICPFTVYMNSVVDKLVNDVIVAAAKIGARASAQLVLQGLIDEELEAIK
jgi:hypothetical protein